jgi:chloramphenicol-sensitive protein RarD
MLSIPALRFLLFWGYNETGIFALSVPVISFLPAGTGIATSVPLLSFFYGARRIKLITVGILQYTAPTITFFLGVFIYHEPFAVYGSHC